MAWLAAVAVSIPILPRNAEACGGLFCNRSVAFPVAQAGEGIVFAVDRQEDLITAVISIQYQGEAGEFAWLLPLQSAPVDVNVAPSAMFSTIDRLTAPRFETRFETEGVCLDRTFAAGAREDAALASTAEEAGQRVQVIRQEEVGPYDSSIIRSDRPEDVRAWLSENGYSVTDEMIDLVTPYVTKGDTLLALKLRKSNDVGDIQPVVVTMEGDEVCVPIRLTAIAALDDMEITTLVLSNEGRAIPENYNHVTLNLAKIDWLNFGANYRQVVAEAADEGSGNAFTTEFSGDASLFRSQIAGQYDRETIEATTTINQFVLALQSQNLLRHREIIGILLRHLPDSAFEAAGTTKEEFRNNPQSFNGQFPNDPFDPTEATAEIWERLVEREIAMQDLFDQYRFATRLYTLISPEEMTLDPTFSFDPSLLDVSNIHRATATLDCGIGGKSDDDDLRITLEIEETGQVIELGDGEVDRSILDQMPAAATVEQLEEGRTLRDNSEIIENLLDRHNRSLGCGCTGAEGRGSVLAGLLLLAGLALVVARKRG